MGGRQSGSTNARQTSKASCEQLTTSFKALIFLSSSQPLSLSLSSFYSLYALSIYPLSSSLFLFYLFFLSSR